jgi:hypothetical protein
MQLKQNLSLRQLRHGETQAMHDKLEFNGYVATGHSCKHILGLVVDELFR